MAKRTLARIIPGTATWTYELEKSRKDRRVNWCANPLEKWVVDPPDQARLPPEGSWILILRELPPLQEDVHLKVRPGAVFWGVRQPGCDPFGFSSQGTYKVLARTPWGNVGLWPYEYSRIEPERILCIWDKKDLVFHPLVENLRFTDALFYLRSRGIGLEEAMVMALGSFNGPVGWFEPAPEVAEQCAQLGKHGIGDYWKGLNETR